MGVFVLLKEYQSNREFASGTSITSPVTKDSHMCRDLAKMFGPGLAVTLALPLESLESAKSYYTRQRLPKMQQEGGTNATRYPTTTEQQEGYRPSISAEWPLV